MSEQERPQDDAGFQLPPPVEPSPVEPGSAATTVAPSPIQIEIGVTDTASRDLLIGGAIFVVLMVAYFFARGAYANMLVRKRIPPVKANAAGWGLFIFLGALSAGVVLAVINPLKFFAPLTIGVTGIVALFGLILMVLSSRR